MYGLSNCPQEHPPFSPYGYGELMARPSGGDVIYMNEGFQIY